VRAVKDFSDELFVTITKTIIRVLMATTIAKYRVIAVVESVVKPVVSINVLRLE